jgi:subfamily B ATP-binding cassette protein MsbA
VIFNDTIFNNVTFWDEPTAENKERFIEALKKASIYDMVMSQPLEGDALLGSNGINVSGGQKQRLSIARELYKEVDFLFMDEATSALDSETEKEIQENIEQLKGKYTLIIIAHRLSTIKDADRIVILNKGEIVQVGNFEELFMNSASFKKMVELQGF